MEVVKKTETDEGRNEMLIFRFSEFGTYNLLNGEDGRICRGDEWETQGLGNHTNKEGPILRSAQDKGQGPPVIGGGVRSIN